MLVLNEDDNQGVRYELLPLLLSLSRLDAARALMERYVVDCDWNVVFSWGRVLELFLSEVIPEKAVQAPEISSSRQLQPRQQRRSAVLRRNPDRCLAGASQGRGMARAPIQIPRQKRTIQASGAGQP